MHNCLGRGAHCNIVNFIPAVKFTLITPMYVVQAEQKANLLVRLEEAIPPEVMGFGMGEFDVSHTRS